MIQSVQKQWLKVWFNNVICNIIKYSIKYSTTAGVLLTEWAKPVTFRIEVLWFDFDARIRMEPLFTSSTFNPFGLCKFRHSTFAVDTYQFGCFDLCSSPHPLKREHGDVPGISCNALSFLADQNRTVLAVFQTQ